jgi:hypothetical protein
MYAPRDLRNQSRPPKGLMHKWHQNRPTMAYFPEKEMMMHKLPYSYVLFKCSPDTISLG